MSTRLVYADKYDKDFYTLLYFSNLGQIPKKMEHPPTPPSQMGIGFATAKKNYAAAKYFFAGTYLKNVGTFETKRLGV